MSMIRRSFLVIDWQTCPVATTSIICAALMTVKPLLNTDMGCEKRWCNKGKSLDRPSVETGRGRFLEEMGVR